MNRVVCTIGFSKKNLRRFVQLLKEAHVKQLVDIRLNNTSQLSGYSKRQDLEYICELLGIGYAHVPDLAPTQDILTDYKKDKDWVRYERQFAELLRRRQPMSLLAELVEKHSPICLLCSEDKPSRCHRRLVAEYIQKEMPDILIKHLS